MKILQILPELNIGGVETGTVDLAKYLIDHGHEAIVVSHGGTLVPELEAVGAKHYTLPVHKKSFLGSFKPIRELERIILKEKVDIVHARSRVPAWIAFFACRKTKTAFITTCHGYYSDHSFSRVMGWSKLVIVPSEVIGRHMIDDFGVLAQNIRRIPRSVDLEKFNLTQMIEKFRMGYVVSFIGRITPLKGHAYFLKAMAKVIRSIPYTKIWIIGDAPARKEIYREQLEVLVKRLGLVQYVEFLGNRRDIPQLLAKTNLLVLATITEEAFGRVVLEAQAAKVPVVATRVGGVVEIIDDGRTGILVPPKDPETMANAIIRVLKDKNLAENMATAAYEKLKAEFTLEYMASQTIKAYEELLQLKNILVIKLSAIGDVILVTASLKALREKYPEAKIYCLVGEESRTILQRCPYLDDIIVYDPKHKDKGWKGLFKLSRRLRSYNFDKAIDFQNNWKSHLLAGLSFPLESFGYDRKGGFLLSHRIKDDPSPLPPVEHQFRILKMLGIDFKPDARLELWPSPKDEKYVQMLLDSEWLGNSQHIIGINISASEKWITKNWPLKHIARLCDLLATKGLRVVITGMEKDRVQAQELLTMTKARPAIFAGKTDIMQLAALIKRCKVFISPDSAPLHVAAAMKTPFIALFGPTDPDRHLPPAKYCEVIQKNIPCVPCYKTYCKISTHACLADITPEEVLERIEKLLKVHS